MQGIAIQRFALPAALEQVGEANPQIGFLEDVQQTGGRPALEYFGLQVFEVFRVGLRVQRGDADTVLATIQNLDARILRHSLVQHAQGIRDCFLQPVDERFHILRQLQRFIVGGAAGLEVGWQIFVWVAETVSANDPDFLAAQAFAQRLQYANFIVDAIDALFVILAFFHHDVAPFAFDDAIYRHHSVGEKYCCVQSRCVLSRPNASITGLCAVLLERNSSASSICGNIRR